MELIDRVLVRIPEGEENENHDMLKEYVLTVSDSLCLRLGENSLPKLFESICADAVVKMYRRTYYEGISSEGAANITTSFVDDILNEYSDEITRYREQKANNRGNGKVVRFL